MSLNQWLKNEEDLIAIFDICETNNRLSLTAISY